MHSNPRRLVSLTSLIVIPVLTPALGTPARAIDGVLEINNASAVAGGQSMLEPGANPITFDGTVATSIGPTAASGTSWGSEEVAAGAYWRLMGLFAGGSRGPLPVPEPSSTVLLLTGAAFLMTLARRRAGGTPPAA